MIAITTRQWWSDFGSFEAWTKNPHRPHPAQVIRYALQRLGIKPERQAVFLMEALGLCHTTAYSLLQGQWLDSLTRCRLLVKALKIHPPLLGIESRWDAWISWRLSCCERIGRVACQS